MDHHLPLLPLLPEDFLIQVLLFLPVISLLRFKSVCKSWLALIQSSFFIDLHTTFNNSSSSSNKFGSFIFQATELDKYEVDIKLFMLSSGSGSGDGDQKKMVLKVDDLGFLPFYKDFLLTDTLRMVGSCNGIICLHDPMLLDISKGGSRHHYSNLRDVSLWNPATRQFRILPKCIPIEEKKEYMGNWLDDFIAIGFDVKTKDYKVLRITPFDISAMGGGCMCRVQVYSLSTDSWRLLEGINSLPVLPIQEMFRNHGIYMNGSYFFVGKKSWNIPDLMMLSFDFTKEIFTTMQLPDDNKNSSSSVLSYLGDKMAVFTKPPIDYDGGYEYYDIWVLNEQQAGSSSSVVVNKESSWTKLHSLRIKFRRGGQPYSEPRWISNNGEFALISTLTDYDDDAGGYWGDKLQLFNLVTKEAKQDFTIGPRGIRVCRADVYKESLVSIMGGFLEL